MSEAGPGTVSMPDGIETVPHGTPCRTLIPLHPQGRRGRFPFRCGAAIPSVGLRPPDPERHRNSPARHTVQDLSSPCTPRQDRHPSVPHAGPASSCQYSCGADPPARRRRSSSQAEQVLQPGGAGPFSRGTPAPPIQHPRFPAAQVLHEKTDLRQNAPGLAPGCPRTCDGQLEARAILLPSLR